MEKIYCDLEMMGTRLAVKRREYKSSALLMLPKGARSLELNEGVVIDVSPSLRNILNPKDKIIFGEYSGYETKRVIEGKEETILIMTFDDVVCRIKDAPTIIEIDEKDLVTSNIKEINKTIITDSDKDFVPAV